MSGLNKCLFVGRLGKDPATAFTPDGTQVTKFSIAVDESYKNKFGEKNDKVEWVNIVTFGKLAEICGNYLTKGKLVFIEGKLQTKTWEKDEQKHSMTQIVADTMKMLDGKKDEQPRADNGNPMEDVPF